MALMSEKADVEAKLESYNSMSEEFADLKSLVQIAEAENDAVAKAELEKSLDELGKKLAREKLDLMMSGEADNNSAYLEIHGGAGGTEAQDWAEMLLRMYTRWAEAHGYKIAPIDRHDGEEAGIKSATIEISGRGAYGWLKHESGIHRLVRISPFDAGARRHTSFASCWVYPVVDDRISIEIDPADLRIDTYRSSGAGGQHVNKTDSAVRITHIPSGVAVQSQNERSQFQNKDTAMKMLRSRLYNLELEKRAREKEAVNATKSDIGWGSQIRSYVFQPYQMVKDLRTGYETSNVGAAMDGELDGFLSAELVFFGAGK
jgi:peptide chain release factor 2